VRLVVVLLVAPLTVGLGVLCVRRARGNPIGLFLIALGYGTIFGSYTSSAWATNLAAVLIGMFMYLNYWLAFMLIAVYFPTGRFYPPRLERWGNRLVGAAVAAFILLNFTAAPAFEQGAGDELLATLNNPLFIPVLEPIFFPTVMGIIVVMGGWGIVSQVLRYRSASRQERLQIRLLLVGYAGVMILSMIVTMLDSVLPEDAGRSDYFRIFTESMLVASTVAHPAAVGTAILRYHLYDIDIIIRRTLIYSVITAILAGVYFGGVALLQTLFVAITGQQSPLAVVASTLAIAALFTPLRRRVQNVVDRRFFRRKYDADKTVDAFARAVRDEVDIDLLRGELVRVVEETMQPAHVSLWLRK
jgi:hypothetical protein